MPPEMFIVKTRDSAFDPLIVRFDPCSRGQKSTCAPETLPKPNKAAYSHTSRSRLQNERLHAEKDAKNAEWRTGALRVRRFEGRISNTIPAANYT